MTPNEFEYYAPIGQTLISNKYCQNDDYFHGYAKNVQLVKGTMVDVCGMHYDLDESCATSNYLSFTGHVVEVKHSQTAAMKDVQKNRASLDEISQISLKWQGGLNRINFYVAFVADHVSQEMLSECRTSGIGILRLQPDSQGRIAVTEELPPVEAVIRNGIPHASQKSVGTFENAILRENVFRVVLKVSPEKIFDDLIRPKQKQYSGNKALEHAFDYMRTSKGKEALKYVYSKIRSSYPTLGARASGRYPQASVLFYNRNENDVILQLEVQQKNFKIYMGDSARYRVTTKDDILEYKQENGGPYGGSLPALLDSEILPWLSSQLSECP